MTRFEGHHMVGDEPCAGKKVHVAIENAAYHRFEPKNTRHEQILRPSSQGVDYSEFDAPAALQAGHN
jgi:hypothetical protein